MHSTVGPKLTVQGQPNYIRWKAEFCHPSLLTDKRNKVVQGKFMAMGNQVFDSCWNLL